ncbi:MAG: UDP-N-acetylenolpyruvoylglucosamine reductase [Bacteroidales bacterium 36-12]|nr:MAG: UDP-N-acetylenolpyruvoylglucosamine reductase [Bacteroidales bacterium 36-12]
MQKFIDYSLLNHNTFGVDVKAKIFIEFDSTDELIQYIKEGNLVDNKYLVIGQGSNLLFLNDFDGVVLHSAINGIELIEENEDSVIIEVGSVVIVDDLIEYCVDRNWAGIENLSLIPGEVGAAAVQNIGAYGVEIKDVVQKVKAVRITDAEKINLTQSECKYAYRDSIFKKELKNKLIITSVVLKLSKRPVYNLSYQHLETAVKQRGELNLRNIRQTIIDIRESKLPNPKVIGNAGSFFMNPVVSIEKFNELISVYPNLPHYHISNNTKKIPAAWLIDQCGWKGKVIGNVGVYEKQALVLINCGGAKGKEIADLSYKIQTSVKDKFGIKLTPEVNFID